MKKKSERLVIKTFHISDVQFGSNTSLKENTLTISHDALQINPFSDYVEKAEIQIIRPYAHNLHVNSIIDIMPISTKVLGDLGTGITHTLTGIYVLLTAIDGAGRQINGFGSSDGILQEKLCFGKAGSPQKDDFILHVNVTVKSDILFNRDVAFSMFQVCDTAIQTIRDILKMKNGSEADSRYDYVDKPSANKTKIAIVKQVAGQGAMYDNLLFSNEPSGIVGGMSIIDMNNMPIILTPNEYRDGALRALT